MGPPCQAVQASLFLGRSSACLHQALFPLHPLVAVIPSVLSQPAVQHTTFTKYAPALSPNSALLPSTCFAEKAPVKAPLGWESPPVPLASEVIAAPAFPAVDFNDPEAVYRGRSNSELLKVASILGLCSIKPLVNNADALLAASQKLIGASLTQQLVRRTLFGHFCAGEDAERIRPTLAKLRANGVGAILDFSVEDDINDTPNAGSSGPQLSFTHNRVYSEEDRAAEEACDAFCDIKLRTVRLAAARQPPELVALKMTALMPPHLLQRTASGLTAARQLLAGLRDAQPISMLEIEQAGQQAQLSADRLQRVHSLIAHKHDLSPLLSHPALAADLALLFDVAAMVQSCRGGATTPSIVPLTAHELGLIGNMVQRLETLCDAAAEGGVRLLLDAEQTYFQPTVDYTAFQLQCKYNLGGEALLYNTYQCYLKGTPSRLASDMERTAAAGATFGAKLVRGAYRGQELRRAELMRLPSPVHDNIEDTHAAYDRCVGEVMEAAAAGRAQVFVATHNQLSVERALAGMRALGLPPSGGAVRFGQLLGMCDHLSLTLGRAGYQAYKVVPFGPVEVVMPYLIRRAQENSDILGGNGRERRLLRAELIRRFSALLRPSGAAAAMSHGAGYNLAPVDNPLAQSSAVQRAVLES